MGILSRLQTTIMSNYIVITTMPLGTPKEEAFDCAVDDRELINAICEYSKELRKGDIEIFERKKNVIATEKGYYIAWYEDDLRSMEGGIDNPTPYRGKDNRMKVTIKAEDGRWVEEDLATLVAMGFCENLKGYKKVWFKDSNYENCNADNLFWISKWKYILLKTLSNLGIKIHTK